MTPQLIKSISGRVYRTLPLSIRYGRIYSKYARLLEESQWWSEEKLRVYQWQKLKVLLKHAYKNVPYYKRVFDEIGLKPEDIQDFDNFRKIPFLTKEIVRENLQDLVARNYPKSKLLYVTTGGSIGIPLGLYYEKGVARSKELAFLTAQWSRVGYKIGDKLAVLRGNVVQGTQNGRLWEFEPIKNRLILSSYHMIDENLPLYVKQIRKFKPKFLHVYPSALTILANFMKKNKVEPFPSVKAVLAGSENMYPWQLKLFQEVFQCTIFSWYGLGELSALAGTCEKSNYYHIFSEYSYVELIAKDEQPITEEDAIGEIVGTTFDNDIMPLIRYKTQDFAVYTKQKCECGRSYPLLKKIEGRLQEFIYTKSNNLISLGPAIFGIHDIDWIQVNQIQFIQERKGELTIRIVSNPGFSKEKIEKYVLNLFEERLNGVCDLRITFVDKIPRAKSGKFHFLIQKLPVNIEDINCLEERYETADSGF